MITADLATAQILFILVSDNRVQLQEMTRDLKQSRYRYFFAPHGEKTAIVESVRRTIADNDARLPMVLLINCKFAGKDCITLLELARDVAKSAAIECVVTHPPVLESRRRMLSALGARIFDNEDRVVLSELSLH